MNLTNENGRVCNQLELLFSLYNKQKTTIERLENIKKNFESEQKTYNEQIEQLEKEKEKLRIDQIKETEATSTRYKVVSEEMEQRLKALENRLTTIEEEKHKLTLSNIDLKEQLRVKEKKVVELEYSLENTKYKLEREIETLTRQKTQLTQDNRHLEKKLEAAQKETERHAEEEKKMHKEIVKLTYSNEELSDEVQRWKRKCNATKNIGRKDDLIDTPNTQRLAEIEQKLEIILKHQKNNSNISRAKSPEHESQNTEEDEDEESLEELLKNLAGQILEKDELKNANIIKMFKLDQIQLNDKENEYKNLLRAMGGLYFANKYNKLTRILFATWKERWEQKANNGGDEELREPGEVRDDYTEDEGVQFPQANFDTEYIGNDSDSGKKFDLNEDIPPDFGDEQANRRSDLGEYEYPDIDE